MESALDTVEYLARSSHRVEVLDAIRAEPRTREEVRELTDASRVTAGRILADLEDRGWIARNGSRYEATASGRFVATEFGRLLGNLRAFRELPSVVDWFPEGQPAFDLSRLDDAAVVTAEAGDLIAPIHRALDLIEGADHVRAVGNGASREFVEAVRDAVAAGQTNALLGPAGMVDALRADPGLRAAMRETLESGRATLLQYEGDDDLPVLQVADGRVALCSGDHGAMVETDDEAVHEWAVSYFSSLTDEARRVPAEAFADEAAVVGDGAFVE